MQTRSVRHYADVRTSAMRVSPDSRTGHEADRAAAGYAMVKGFRTMAIEERCRGRFRAKEPRTASSSYNRTCGSLGR